MADRKSMVIHLRRSEHLGGLVIDDKLELGRRLHRQVGRLLALEDAIDVASRPGTGRKGKQTTRVATRFPARRARAVRPRFLFDIRIHRGSQAVAF